MACCGQKTAGKDPKLIPKESKISVSKLDYSITIKTGNLPQAGINGPVYIQMFGRDDKKTEDLLLTKSPNDQSFPPDSTRIFPIQANDIGKPQRIRIRHEDTTNGWYLDYVEISVREFSIRFVANRWLAQAKHDGKLSAELFASEQPAVKYQIEIETGSEQSQPMDSPVYIQIYGATANTPKIFLEPKTNSFDENSIENFTFSSNNVGQIVNVVIGHEGRGSVNDWHLRRVKLQQSEQQEEFIVDKCLSSTKDDQQLFVKLTPGETSSLLPYLITIQTADVPQAETKEQIQMNIQGSKGRIEKIFVKDYAKSNAKPLFQTGSIDQFEIQHNNIGNIESITIGFDPQDPKSTWLLEDVNIKWKANNYHFRAQSWLSNRLGPGFTWITMKPDTNHDDINYQITVETGQAGIDSNVVLCIYGDENTTANLALKTIKDGSQGKFTRASQLEFHLNAIDVGRIKKINIGHDGQEQQWFLKSVRITKNNERYTFKADRWLSKEKADKQTYIDLLSNEQKSDQAIYTINVVTNSNIDAGTDSGVFISIYGDKNQTKQVQLIKTKQGSEALFKPGTTNTFQIQLNDVGIINKINIGQDSKGLQPSWHLDTVEIEKESDIYKFTADTVLDLSMPYINLLPTPSDKSSVPVIVKRNNSLNSTANQQMKEIPYKISLQATSRPQGKIHETANLYLIIVGDDGQTKKIRLRKDAKTGKIEHEFKAIDVGPVSKIILGQDKNEHNIVWRVDNAVVRRGTETTTFEAQCAVEQDTNHELTPLLLHGNADVHYDIKTTTGEDNFQGDVAVCIRGEHGVITIPLLNTKTGQTPFQSKSIDQFTCCTTDVGRIKRIQVETPQATRENVLNLRQIQIFKGNHVYHFDANIRIDNTDRKVILYPVPHRKEDYVETQLRRLRDDLRNESAKRRRPPKKAHAPFVYNDLNPYFDTSTVEKAMYEPLDSTAGYYTRLTALRIVEPWEAYGMDYGVNYELLKQRKLRSKSAKRPTTTTQIGMMILPPLALPFGGQVTYVNPAQLDNNTHKKSPRPRPHSPKQNTN